MNNYNVIIITIDCLREDFSGFNNNLYKESNFISNFVKEGAVFNTAFANGPITPYSFPSLFTSVYPFIFPDEVLYSLALENTFPIKLSNRRVTLAEVLQNEGYYTVGIQDSNPFLTSFFGYKRGFDIFEDFIFKNGKEQKRFTFLSIEDIIKKVIKDNSKLKRLGWAVQCLSNLRQIKGAKQVAKRALVEIKRSIRSNKPIFLWAHFMDAHFMYSPPREYSQRLKWFFTVLRNIGTDWQKLPKDKIEILRKLYEMEIKYIYDVVYGLFTTFKKLGIDKNNSFFIITADHGEEFAEHGDLSHSSKLYNELLHIPLAIIGPGISKRIISDPVSLIDIPPTILDLLNLKNPKQFKGKSLKENLANNSSRFEQGPIVSLSLIERDKLQIASQTSEWKCIAETIDADIVNSRFFNLKNDPEESYALSGYLEKEKLLESIRRFLEIKKIYKKKNIL